MNKVLRGIGIFAVLVFPVCAQDGPRGHWTGSIEIPGQSMAMEVDLDKTANSWTGSIAIPAQNVSGLPLEPITFTNGNLTFHIKSAPGDPTFTGTLSNDGKTMSGNFTQGPGAFPFKFSRTGDPKVETVKSSPAVAKQFAGTWEGTLQASQSLRLMLKLSNDDTGAKGVLTSLEQGGIELPVSSISQKDSKLTLNVKMVSGEFEGEINKAGSELNGIWSQGGGSFPLTLVKKP